MYQQILKIYDIGHVFEVSAPLIVKHRFHINLIFGNKLPHSFETCQFWNLVLREYLDGRHAGKLGSAGKDSYFDQLEMIGVRMADVKSFIPSKVDTIWMLLYRIYIFLKIAQARGRSGDLFGFHLFSLPTSALDHSATASPLCSEYT